MADRRSLVAPRGGPTLDATPNAAGGWDVDAFHAMERRDEQLISEELLNGAASAKFVYSFNLSGTNVHGISVIGARHLAAHYQGLQHRLVASMEKIGSLFTFTSFPQAGMPMSVSCSVVGELADEPDFYGVVVEVRDIKTGNTIQIERREKRYETKRNGESFERPNYATIAQSKAYRNAVLALIPQDVLIKWRDQMLATGKGENVTSSVIDEKRAGVIRYAARMALPIAREAVQNLTMDQIAGLSDAARDGNQAMFAQSARSLGLLGDGVIDDEIAQPAKPKAVSPPPPSPPPPSPAAASVQTGGQPEPGQGAPPPASAEDYGQGSKPAGDAARASRRGRLE